MKAKEQYKLCSTKEQRQIQTVFWIFQKKKFKNMEKIYHIAQGLVREERAYYKQKSKEFLHALHS
ncbi:MAG: hypothetical protein J0647_01535 [Campylobacteraceae bacterium]|nr:hypothetical protein [Campylobacteraceae bacterium]